MRKPLCICSLPFVDIPASSQEKIISKLKFPFIPGQLENPAENFSPFCFAQFRQLRNDFQGSHNQMITGTAGPRNRYSEVP